MKDEMKFNNLGIISGLYDDALEISYISIEKFNKNYHKLVSDESNKYFIIPVSNIENLFYILRREQMPKIFEKISVCYTIHISRQSENQYIETIHSQSICTELDTPHSLFTFLFNLQELAIFNVLFNKTCEDSANGIYVYNVIEYKINDEIPKQIIGVNDLIDDIMILYGFPDVAHVKVEYDHLGNSINLARQPGTVAYEDQLQIIIHGNNKCIIRDAKLSNYQNRGELLRFVTKIDNVILKSIRDSSKDAVYTVQLSHVRDTSELQLFTFISKLQMQSLYDIIPTAYKKGLYTIGFGINFDTDDWQEADGSFSQIKSSTHTIINPMDYVIMLKLVPGLLRIVYNLVSMPTQFHLLEDMTPFFSYNFELKPKLVTIRRDCHTNDDIIAGHYFRDYIIKSEEDIYKIDPYTDFIYDVMDYVLPF